MATDQLAASSSESPAAAEEASVAKPARPMRFWPVVLLLGVFWAYAIGNFWMELAPGQRFLSRMVAYALVFVGFLIWWMLQRSISWRDRFAALALFFVGSAVMLQLADPSIGIMAIFMGAAPLIFTAWVAALWLTRNGLRSTRRLAVAAVTLLVLAYYLLVRFDGIDGWQQGEMSWRWSPTAEQAFLESHRSVNFPVANSAGPWTVQPNDVTGFRGANRDGVIRGTKLALDWNAAPPKQLWRQRLGPAWSSVIVVDGRVVTQEQRGNSEVVACYDAETGKEVWAHEDPIRFHESLSGAGPRGTPVFADGMIYALGGKGTLNCLDSASGKPVWSHDLVADAQAEVPQWGFSVSPVVADGKVIVYANGKQDFGLVAYDAATGEQKWKLDRGGQSYSSPQLVELDGERQILMYDSHGLRSASIGDGTILWEYPLGDGMNLPMLQPNVVGANQLLLAVDPGVRLLEVKRDGGEWKISDVWDSNRLKPSFNDVLVHKGKVYGLDDGILCALDLATGERLWKKGRYGNGQIILLADQDALLVQGARGEVILVDISGEEPKELGKFEAIEGKTWNHPALVGQRLFVRNGEEIACYELPAAN